MATGNLNLSCWWIGPLSAWLTGGNAKRLTQWRLGWSRSHDSRVLVEAMNPRLTRPDDGYWHQSELRLEIASAAIDQASPWHG